MDREKVIEQATSNAARGFLCSESVLLAFSKWLGIQSELIPRIATGFGAGVGSCGSICGSLSGGVMALGLKFGRNDSKRQEGRRPYWFAQELCKRFENEFGYVTCRELTGCILTTEEGRRRYADEKMWETRCRRYIGSVAAIVFDLITENASLEDRRVQI